MDSETLGAKRLLVVDDDPVQVETVRNVLEAEGVTVATATSGEQALALIETVEPSGVLLDVRLPGLSGLETLRQMRSNGYFGPVVLMTGYASVETATEALEGGAEDFLTKPMTPSDLRAVADRMLANGLGADGVSEHCFDTAARELRVIGKSPQLIEVSKLIVQVSRSEIPVLIQGEIGTGKELVACVIHQRSRRPGPFVGVNCARVPAAVLERELFILMEQAAMGTLFVDEVGAMSLPLQKRFLEAIETGQFPSADGSGTASLSARLIAASSTNLAQKAASTAFGPDLYYRIAGVTIDLPPLRERAGDIRLLTDFFAHRLAAKLGRRLTGLSEGVYQRLGEYSWPGNVRELRSVVERSLLGSSGHVLTTSDLRDLPSTPVEKPAPVALADYAKAGKMLEDVAWDYINQVLAETCGNQSEAARRLGIHRNTLRRMIQHREVK
jgi:DNA-binding NtrC family response regulator